MIVHRFWMGAPRAMEWSRAVIEQTQCCPVTDWSPDTLPEDARWALESGYPRDVSNRVRYWLLAKMGGLWLDHDVIPLRQFPQDAWTAALDQNREGSAICFPEPGHPMAEALLRVVQNVPARANPVQLTGARLLTRVGKRYPNVRLEHRVLPHDAVGHPTGVKDPLAVHMWESSSENMEKS